MDQVFVDQVLSTQVPLPSHAPPVQVAEAQVLLAHEVPVQPSPAIRQPIQVPPTHVVPAAACCALAVRRDTGRLGGVAGVALALSAVAVVLAVVLAVIG